MLVSKPTFLSMSFTDVHDDEIDFRAHDVPHAMNFVWYSLSFYCDCQYLSSFCKNRAASTLFIPATSEYLREECPVPTFIQGLISSSDLISSRKITLIAVQDSSQEGKTSSNGEKSLITVNDFFHFDIHVFTRSYI